MTKQHKYPLNFEIYFLDFSYDHKNPNLESRIFINIPVQNSNNEDSVLKIMFEMNSVFMKDTLSNTVHLGLKTIIKEEGEEEREINSDKKSINIQDKYQKIVCKPKINGDVFQEMEREFVNFLTNNYKKNWLIWCENKFKLKNLNNFEDKKEHYSLKADKFLEKSQELFKELLHSNINETLIKNWNLEFQVDNILSKSLPTSYIMMNDINKYIKYIELEQKLINDEKSNKKMKL